MRKCGFFWLFFVEIMLKMRRAVGFCFVGAQLALSKIEL